MRDQATNIVMTTESNNGHIIEASIEQSVIVEPQKNFPLKGTLPVQNNDDEVQIRLVSA